MLRVPRSASRVPVLVLFVLAASDEFRATREAFVERINAARVAAGVKPVRLSPVLSAVAQSRAEQIAAGGTGKAAAVEEDLLRAAKQGYDAHFLAEVHAQADGDVETVMASWQEEGGATARELVTSDHREVGVGVARKDDVPLYVFLFASTSEEFFREKTGSLGDRERFRREMLTRVNRERAQRKLPPLRRNRILDDAAQAHADDMLKRRYYGHDTPEGRTVMDRVQARGYPAFQAGENIARGQYSVDEVMDGWIESPIHREHLLSKIFDEVGFGLAFGKTPDGYTTFWVQDFARARPRFKR